MKIKSISFGYRKILTLIAVAFASMILAPVEAGRFSKILNEKQSQWLKEEEAQKAAERHPVLGDLLEDDSSTILS